MTYGSLFSGVGGIDLGLDRAGMVCRWQVENDPYAIRVLEKHWPEVTRYGDITTVHGADLEPVDLICGGFPCQDLSQAGKRAGIEGSRSGLWFEYARIVGVVRPRFVLIENVPGLLVPTAMSRVVGELARLGYVGAWRSLRASEFGASHLRKRVFIVAYREGAGLSPKPQDWLRGGLSNRSGQYGADLAYRNEGRCEVQRSSGLFDGERETRRDDVNGCDPHVAHGTLRGLGELREPSGCNGLPDGSHEDLADPINRLLQKQGRGPEGRDGAGSGSTYMEFAPGPSDPRWPFILRERPDLAPALVHAKRSTVRDVRGRSRDDEGADDEAGEIRGIGGMHAGESSTGDGREGRTAPPQPPIRGVALRLPNLLDGAMSNRTKRLGRLGNAVVPQIAEWMGRRILEFEEGRK